MIHIYHLHDYLDKDIIEITNMRQLRTLEGTEVSIIDQGVYLMNQ